MLRLEGGGEQWGRKGGGEKVIISNLEGLLHVFVVVGVVVVVVVVGFIGIGEGRVKEFGNPLPGDS